MVGRHEQAKQDVSCGSRGRWRRMAGGDFPIESSGKPSNGAEGAVLHRKGECGESLQADGRLNPERRVYVGVLERHSSVQGIL